MPFQAIKFFIFVHMSGVISLRLCIDFCPYIYSYKYYTGEGI